MTPPPAEPVGVLIEVPVPDDVLSRYQTVAARVGCDWQPLLLGLLIYAVRSGLLDRFADQVAARRAADTPGEE